MRPVILILSLIYSLNFSIGFPVAGRLIAGVVSSLKPVMTGEIARSCETEAESISAFMSNGAGWIFGFFIGPVINISFTMVNLHVGEWHLNNTNFIGIFMSFVYIVVIVLTFFGVHDLSLEYDPKEEAEMERQSNRTKYGSLTTETDTSIPLTGSVNVTEEKHTTTLQVLRTLLTSFDTITLIICSMMARFVIALFEAWVSLICIELLNWNMTSTNAFMVCCAVPSCITLFALTKVCLEIHFIFSLAIQGVYNTSCITS